MVQQITPDLRWLGSDISWDWWRMSEAQLSLLTSRIISLDNAAWGTLPLGNLGTFSFSAAAAILNMKINNYFLEALLLWVLKRN
jgi:hypothetical protein